jgi:hypothetical protein
MRNFVLLFLLFLGTCAFAQDLSYDESKPKKKLDSLYREDQFYFGITYNTLTNTPKGYDKDKIAAGFTAGFLRDMPLNASRTVAIAAGLGLTHNNYNHNLKISGSGKNPDYNLLERGTYSANKLSTLTADFPIELRWRTSTFESTQFWRIYLGAKISYMLYDRSLFEAGSDRIVIKNNNDLNRLGYGVHIGTGYNTFNVYVQYGLNSLFQKGQLAGEQLQMQNFNLGLIFYIL